MSGLQALLLDPIPRPLDRLKLCLSRLSPLGRRDGHEVGRRPTVVPDLESDGVVELPVAGRSLAVTEGVSRQESTFVCSIAVMTRVAKSIEGWFHMTGHNCNRENRLRGPLKLTEDARRVLKCDGALGARRIRRTDFGLVDDRVIGRGDAWIMSNRQVRCSPDRKSF